MVKIRDFDQALAYLYQHVPQRFKKLYPGGVGVERMRYFLNLLDNPQEKFKVIHIAGTSGKGSTATILSQLLKQSGFKVGLTVSPHMTDLRERFQINNQLVSPTQTVKLLNEIMPQLESMANYKYGKLTYFEICIGLAFYLFAQQKVDYGVVEVGLGGLLDGTNVIDNPNKLVVLTRIGRDHSEILGKKLPQIAFQKAGIIQPGNQVIALSQSAAINRIFLEKSLSQNSLINWVQGRPNFKSSKLSATKSTFDFKFGGYFFKNLQLSLIGLHQIENAKVALTSYLTLARRDGFPVDQDQIRQTLTSINFPGRMDILKVRGKTVILDGAHNPQKMTSLIESLKQIYPGQKFVFLISIKRTKDSRSILGKIIPVADKFILTNYFVNNQEWLHLSSEASKLGQKLTKLGFNNFELIVDQAQALNKALAETKKVLVITGSLYFVAEIYPRLRKVDNQ